VPASSGLVGVTKASRPDSAGTTPIATGPTGPVSVTVPVVTLAAASGSEKRSATDSVLGTSRAPSSGKLAPSAGAVRSAVIDPRGVVTMREVPVRGSKISPVANSAPDRSAPPQTSSSPVGSKVAV